MLSKEDVIDNLKFAIDDMCTYNLADMREEIEYAIEHLSASCKTCQWAHERANNLYACYNTEINLMSCQRANFSCNKWAKKVDFERNKE